MVEGPKLNVDIVPRPVFLCLLAKPPCCCLSGMAIADTAAEKAEREKIRIEASMIHVADSVSRGIRVRRVKRVRGESASRERTRGGCERKGNKKKKERIKNFPYNQARKEGESYDIHPCS